MTNYKNIYSHFGFIYLVSDENQKVRISLEDLRNLFNNPLIKDLILITGGKNKEYLEIKII
jgi:hypothetical protein